MPEASNIDKHSSRSAVACNTCRTRKQKCGGEKPTCARCRQLNFDCTWPQKQKRGPAKGYTEALESRLSETEDVLFRILPYVSTEQLSEALMKNPLGEREREKLSTLDRKLAVDGWGRMALRTVDGVRGWYEERWRWEGLVNGEVRGGVGDGEGIFGGRVGGDIRRNGAFVRLQDGVGNADLRNQETRGRGREEQVHSHEPNQGDLTEVSVSGHTGGLSTSEVELVQTNGLGLPQKFRDDFLW